MRKQIFKIVDSNNNLLLLDGSDISFVKSSEDGTTIYMKNGKEIDTKYPFDMFLDFITANAEEVLDFSSIISNEEETK